MKKILRVMHERENNIAIRQLQQARAKYNEGDRQTFLYSPIKNGHANIMICARLALDRDGRLKPFSAANPGLKRALCRSRAGTLGFHAQKGC